MKKFVLVLSCALIILFFAGFNYLLWDRENKAEDIKSLEYTNENKDNYINFLTAEKKRVEIENENYVKEIEQLNKKLDTLNEQMEEIVEKNSALQAELEERNSLVELLLEQVDKQMLAGMVNDYVALLNKREYAKAYAMRYNHGLGYGTPPAYTDFKAMYDSNVEEMTVENLEYTNEYVVSKGKHAFSVEINVQMKEGAEERGSEFVPGINVRIFVVGFDRETSKWVIADIIQPGS